MINKVIGYVRLKSKGEDETEGILAYEFTDVLTDELQKESNADLKELVIENISDLHEIMAELINRSEKENTENEE